MNDASVELPPRIRSDRESRFGMCLEVQRSKIPARETSTQSEFRSDTVAIRYETSRMDGTPRTESLQSAVGTVLDGQWGQLFSGGEFFLFLSPVWMLGSRRHGARWTRMKYRMRLDSRYTTRLAMKRQSMAPPGARRSITSKPSFTPSPPNWA